jgi:hypothetical protein
VFGATHPQIPPYGRDDRLRLMSAGMDDAMGGGRNVTG